MRIRNTRLSLILGVATFGAMLISPVAAQHEILRQAAAREDATEKHVVTPGPLLPAREVLASALLDAGKSADAVREYEAVLTKEPNRLRATAGAALAAEHSGDKQKARMHYGKVLELAANADSPRPEMVNAKRFLGRS